MEKVVLKRNLTLFSLVIFGLATMAPGTVFATFGIASQVTLGKVPGAYILAAFALAFTAYSYGQMVKAFPIAGSAYTYVQRSFNPNIGFLIGWAILTDYLLLPMVNALIFSIFFSSMFPSVPSYFWILFLIAATTVVNIIGTKLVGRLNSLFMGYTIIIIFLFCVLSIKSVIAGSGTATIFSSLPFYNPEHSFSYLLAGASLLCFSFIGFDSITALAEESINAQKNIPKAIFIILFIGAFIFITVSYIASRVHPDYTTFENLDSATLEIAQLIGGNIFASLFLAVTLVGTFSSGLSAQASVSRVLYAMGRDSMLPKKSFGYLHPRFKTPTFNIILVGIISLLALAFSLTLATSLINFGALIAFLFVNLSVISHYFIKQKNYSFKGIVLYLIMPLVGASFIVWLLSGLSKYAIIFGSCWTLLGIIYLVYLVKVAGLKTIDIQFEEEKENVKN
ncbi:APC family permease [Bacillus massiliigorillae]|uniref:APC family permease n=1 Tax=Bacillus massiliigorillae TaxID=1243664 RepID=UPI00039EF352|nr:amino acid permease [Bacillus massiliigorillae]